MLNNLTIIIPTYKRHRQLARLLDYYSNYKLNIFVADSTVTPFPAENISKNVKYYHYPNYSYAKKLPLIYSKVKTKYVVFCADDDFIIPSGILESVNFLEKNADYSSCHGHYAFFQSLNNKDLSAYPFYLDSMNLDVNSNKPSKRVIQLLSAYMQLLYAVTKTADIQQVFKYLTNYPEIKNDNLIEIFQAIILCINGKSKTLPILYCVRERTPNSAGTYTDDLDSFYVKKKYAGEYNIWLEALTKHLAKKEGISPTEAKVTMTSAIKIYLKNSFMYVPFLKISILNIQRILNKYSLGLAKLIYDLIRPSSQQKYLKKHSFFKKDGKKEFENIKLYIKKYDNITLNKNI